jgi:dienelactone hydrolase
MHKNTERDSLRQSLRTWLGLGVPFCETRLQCERIEDYPDFQSRLVSYSGPDGERIPAYLLVPHGLRAPAAAVIVHHQHNGERHFGKSEVCGLVGDPHQALGAHLASQGLVVLAPDSICFEDRRVASRGTEAHPDDALNHFNEMCYRLVKGDTLMRKVLTDAEAAYSALAGLVEVDSERIGLVGHSYGGNTALFQAALDTRVKFACISGAVCSYSERIARGTGIEMAEVLPSALLKFEIDDLLRLISPRQTLVVSATTDKYSRDADVMVAKASPAFSANPEALQHLRYEGGHPLTSERVRAMVAWVVQAGGA